MYTRVLTYDLKNGDSYDYEELYDYFKVVDAKKLTESSYLIKTFIKWAEFEKKIRGLTKNGDNVKCVVINQDNKLDVFNIR